MWYLGFYFHKLSIDFLLLAIGTFHIMCHLFPEIITIARHCMSWELHYYKNELI